MRRVVYVDASIVGGQGRVAWLDDTINKPHLSAVNCKDSTRCEYAAIIDALQHLKGIRSEDEVEIRCDNEVVVKQLNHESAINEEDIRKMAFEIWEWGEKRLTRRRIPVSIVRVLRKDNKAGKMLGS